MVRDGPKKSLIRPPSRADGEIDSPGESRVLELAMIWLEFKLRDLRTRPGPSPTFPIRLGTEAVTRQILLMLLTRCSRPVLPDMMQASTRRPGRTSSGPPHPHLLI